jgi:hypothetical protein
LLFSWGGLLGRGGGPHFRIRSFLNSQSCGCHLLFKEDAKASFFDFLRCGRPGDILFNGADRCRDLDG